MWLLYQLSRPSLSLSLVFLPQLRVDHPEIQKWRVQFFGLSRIPELPHCLGYLLYEHSKCRVWYDWWWIIVLYLIQSFDLSVYLGFLKALDADSTGLGHRFDDNHCVEDDHDDTLPQEILSRFL